MFVHKFFSRAAGLFLLPSASARVPSASAAGDYPRQNAKNAEQLGERANLIYKA